MPRLPALRLAAAAIGAENALFPDALPFLPPGDGRLQCWQVRVGRSALRRIFGIGGTPQVDTWPRMRRIVPKRPCDIESTGGQKCIDFHNLCGRLQGQSPLRMRCSGRETPSVGCAATSPPSGEELRLCSFPLCEEASRISLPPAWREGGAERRVGIFRIDGLDKDKKIVL